MRYAVLLQTRGVLPAKAQARMWVLAKVRRCGRGCRRRCRRGCGCWRRRVDAGAGAGEGAGADVGTGTENIKLNARKGKNKMIVYEKVPHGYMMPATRQGRVKKFNYGMKKYGQRFAYVYTPYGYDGNDMNTRYDILYLLHGANSGIETFLWDESSNSHFKNILDHAIENGEIKPLIVVTPTFYPPGGPAAGQGHEHRLCREFVTELTENLMLPVESMHLTFADTLDDKGFKDSRAHRMFAGFSMGAVTGWYVFAEKLDYFNTFIPMSGDCWALGALGGGSHPKETAKWLAEKCKLQGYENGDFEIFAATGTLDSAYQGLTQQIEAMSKTGNIFHYGTNLHYIISQGGYHDYMFAYDYIYSVLKWKAKS